MSKSDPQKAAGAAAIKTPALIAGVCAAAVVAGGGILYATGVIGGAPEEEFAGIQYATEGVVALDESGIHEEKVDGKTIALEFKNDAYSYDGTTFSCYLGNSAMNKYDMYIAIYEDTSLEDDALLYLSGLVPPGSGFAEIKLDRALDVGDHRVVVAFTQMADPNTMHAQTLYTMDFHVLTPQE